MVIDFGIESCKNLRKANETKEEKGSERGLRNEDWGMNHYDRGKEREREGKVNTKRHNASSSETPINEKWVNKPSK